MSPSAHGDTSQQVTYTSFHARKALGQVACQPPPSTARHGVRFKRIAKVNRGGGEADRADDAV
eukprot:2321999-Rhodomonas_salina.6